MNAAPETSLQGKILEPQTPEQLAEALTLAFDYRGDVILTLKSGIQAEGYLYQFDLKKNSTTLFVKTDEKTSEPQSFTASQVQKIAFTGQDCAFGKSWEAIQKKKAEQASPNL